MTMTRRDFFKALGAAGALVAVPRLAPASVGVAAPGAAVPAAAASGMIRSITLTGVTSMIDATNLASVHLMESRPGIRRTELELEMYVSPGAALVGPGDTLDLGWFEENGLMEHLVRGGADHLLDAWPTDLAFMVTETQLRGDPGLPVTLLVRAEELFA